MSLINRNFRQRIKCKSNLYHSGEKCFTDGVYYELPEGHKYLTSEHQLMEVQVINDLGEPHIIGLWYKNFKLI